VDTRVRYLLDNHDKLRGHGAPLFI